MSIYASRLNVEAILGVTTDAAAEFLRCTSRVWSDASLAFSNKLLFFYKSAFTSTTRNFLRYPSHRTARISGSNILTCGLAQNGIWMKSKKRCFKASNGILNLFSASGLAENAIWWRQKGDDSSGR